MKHTRHRQIALAAFTAAIASATQNHDPDEVKLK